MTYIRGQDGSWAVGSVGVDGCSEGGGIARSILNIGGHPQDDAQKLQTGFSGGQASRDTNLKLKLEIEDPYGGTSLFAAAADSLTLSVCPGGGSASTVPFVGEQTY